MRARWLVGMAGLATAVAATGFAMAQPAAQGQPAPAVDGIRDEPAPDGAAAPARPLRWVGAGGLEVEASLEVFAQYALEVFDGTDGETEWFHAFELPRAHAGLAAHYQGAEGKVRIEAVRSASEGALVGVAGDSLVMRLRDAYAGYTAFDVLQIRGGVVPTMTIAPIEQAHDLRAVTPTAVERAGLLSPADLGVTAKGLLPLGLGFVGVGAYNGEGYTSRELNRGKNIEIAAAIHPLALVPVLAPLTVGGSYVAGSSGTGLARSNRVTGGLWWETPRIRGGATMTYALGVADVGDQSSLVLEAFARVEPIERFILGADVAYWLRNVDVSDDAVTSISGAVGYRIVDPLEAYLAVDRAALGDTAEAALPGQDQWRFRTIARIHF